MVNSTHVKVFEHIQTGWDGMEPIAMMPFRFYTWLQSAPWAVRPFWIPPLVFAWSIEPDSSQWCARKSEKLTPGTYPTSNAILFELLQFTRAIIPCLSVLLDGIDYIMFVQTSEESVSRVPAFNSCYPIWSLRDCILGFLGRTVGSSYPAWCPTHFRCLCSRCEAVWCFGEEVSMSCRMNWFDSMKNTNWLTRCYIVR